MRISLPLGTRFRFTSLKPIDEARRAIRGKMDKNPGALDEVWGVAFGPFVFLQAGLVGSPPALFAWIRRRGSRLTISGYAGLNLAGLAFLFLILIVGVLFGAILAIVGRGWTMLAGAAGGLILLYAIAWSNHVFREDADHLVRLLKRAMQAEELQGQFRTADLLKVEDATLLVNGNAQDESPSPHDISEAVLNLRTGQFVIVAFDEEIYMQALKRQQGYGLEHRAGSADQHFRLDAEIEPQALIDTLVAYLRREQSWAALQWERMRL